MADIGYSKIKLTLEQFDSLCTQMDAKITRQEATITTLTAELEGCREVVGAANKLIESFIPTKCLDIPAYKSLRKALNKLKESKG